MSVDISVYSLRDYGGEAQLEALVTREQLAQALLGGLVRWNGTRRQWRLTAAGERVITEAGVRVVREGEGRLG